MTIDLQKHPDQADDDGLVGGVPGYDLELRADDELELRRSSDLVPYRPVQTLVVRARQATARGWVRVVDQPAIIRATAVTRQSPRVARQLAGYTPNGIVRAIRLLDRYLRDPETLELMASCAELKDAVGYERAAVAREKKNLPGHRRVVLAAALTSLIVGLAWWAPQAFAGVLAAAVFAGVVASVPRRGLLELAVAAGLAAAAWFAGPWLASYVPQPPWWAWWVLLAIAVPVLGWLGRDRDQKLVEMPAQMVPHQAPSITAPMVINALCSIGISAIKEPDQVRLLMDVHRHGPGVQVDLEVPTAAAEVVCRRERLAAVMRRELGCVWPKVGARHAGHLSIYFSDQAMRQQEQEPWPLAHATGPIDVFEPQPMFTTQIGEWMRIRLMFLSIVIGAIPRMGKTFIVRQIGLIFAMDIRARLYLFDGKGTGDFNPLRPCAHFISCGEDPEEIEDRVLPTLRGLQAELRRRAKVINGLSDEEVPESKVTSQLASRRDLGLYPIFIGIDETQIYYQYGSSTNKKHKAIRNEIIEITTDLAKRGPALGINLAQATQNICEETIPRQISLVALLRIALNVLDATANNKILGDGAYGRGIDATAFDRTDTGIAWIAGESSRPEIGRSVVDLDGPAVRKLALRAAGWRRAAGWLTGQAADEDDIVDAEVVYDIRADAEQVMNQRGSGKAQWVELVEWLRDLRGQYAELTEDELSTSLRAAGINSRDVRSGSSVRKGVYISDLRKQGGDDDDE